MFYQVIVSALFQLPKKVRPQTSFVFEKLNLCPLISEEFHFRLTFYLSKSEFFFYLDQIRNALTFSQIEFLVLEWFFSVRNQFYLFSSERKRKSEILLFFGYFPFLFWKKDCSYPQTGLWIGVYIFDPGPDPDCEYNLNSK